MDGAFAERCGIDLPSTNSRLPAAGPVAYSAAKSALTSLGKSPAEESGPRGVRAKCGPTSSHVAVFFLHGPLICLKVLGRCIIAYAEGEEGQWFAQD